jgi:dolichyl-phosphate-mannose--protein O-mannosyl transferase
MSCPEFDRGLTEGIIRSMKMFNAFIVAVLLLRSMYLQFLLLCMHECTIKKLFDHSTQQHFVQRSVKIC